MQLTLMCGVQEVCAPSNVQAIYNKNLLTHIFHLLVAQEPMHTDLIIFYTLPRAYLYLFFPSLSDVCSSM